MDDWVKEHGVKLFHNRVEGLWYDAEGVRGYKFTWAQPAGMNWNKGKTHGVKGKVWSAAKQRERASLMEARGRAGCYRDGVSVNVGADIRKGKDGVWYVVEK